MPASPGRPRTQAPPSCPFAGNLADILCVQEDRVVGNDNTVRYKNLSLQIPAGRHRHHYVKAKVSVHEYPDGDLAVFHGPRCLARYKKDGTPIRKQRKAGRVIRFDATGRRPVDTVDRRSRRPTTSPQGQKPQQKRSNHMVHKPVNSVCYRQRPRPQAVVNGTGRRAVRFFPAQCYQHGGRFPYAGQYRAAIAARSRP